VIANTRIHELFGAHSQPWASECPAVKNYKWRLNPVWHIGQVYPYGNSGRRSRIIRAQTQL